MKVCKECKRWLTHLKQQYGKGRSKTVPAFCLDDPWMWVKNDKSKKKYVRLGNKDIDKQSDIE